MDARHQGPDVPVIDLSTAPGERLAWDRPTWLVYLWGICELLFVTNPWQISSGLRIRVLRAFGAEIGSHVVFRPRTRVRFPWKLHIGDRSWIGEGVWFHNQDHVYVGSDVVISQETMLTTGSHAHRRDMALLTRPIRVEDGAWGHKQMPSAWRGYCRNIVNSESDEPRRPRCPTKRHLGRELGSRVAL